MRFPPLETLPFKADEMWEFPDGHTVIYLANDLAYPYTLSSSNIFKEEAEQRLRMTYAVLDSASDLNKEQDNFDQAIAGEYDVIIYHALDTTSGGANINRARRAGQIVMAYAENTLVRPTARWAKDTYAEGLWTAQWMGEQLGSGAKVAGAVGDLVQPHRAGPEGRILGWCCPGRPGGRSLRGRDRLEPRGVATR